MMGRSKWLILRMEPSGLTKRNEPARSGVQSTICPKSYANGRPTSHSNCHDEGYTPRLRAGIGRPNTCTAESQAFARAQGPLVTIHQQAECHSLRTKRAEPLPSQGFRIHTIVPAYRAHAATP